MLTGTVPVRASLSSWPTRSGADSAARPRAPRSLVPSAFSLVGLMRSRRSSADDPVDLRFEPTAVHSGIPGPGQQDVDDRGRVVDRDGQPQAHQFLPPLGPQGANRTEIDERQRAVFEEVHVPGVRIRMELAVDDDHAKDRLRIAARHRRQRHSLPARGVDIARRHPAQPLLDVDAPACQLPFESRRAYPERGQECADRLTAACFRAQIHFPGEVLGQVSQQVVRPEPRNRGEAACGQARQPAQDPQVGIHHPFDPWPTDLDDHLATVHECCGVDLCDITDCP